jgi:hypothetical protein
VSELHDIIGSTVDDRASVTTDPIVNLRTGATFYAEIESNPDISLDAELGKDLREQVVLHVRSTAEADGIRAQDKVTFTLFGQFVTFQIVERANNPANPFVEFRARKVVSGIDT